MAFASGARASDATGFVYSNETSVLPTRSISIWCFGPSKRIFPDSSSEAPWLIIVAGSVSSVPCIEYIAAWTFIFDGVLPAKRA